ncbi:YceI family protein [Pseudomarimonas salicorniae]|nr:YceI family protein [Lysobacter sp. CAU 1642]
MLSLVAPATLPAAERDYRIDPVHTRVAFSVGHLGLSRAIGTFSGPRGWLNFDPDDFSTARGEIEVDLTTLDLGDEDWNRRMARSDSFDSERHPIARWSVRRVEPTGEHSFNAEGVLALRGGEYPLTLAVTFNGVRRHPLTFRRTAGFSARATLSRAALGMDKWKTMVGDAVELQVEVEARRGKRRADGGFDEDPADRGENEHAMAQ